ncbi:hypothetical protein NLJ89_g7768 [Agrocybe chaxingu]|uniref:Uncharacterized protein n=1 Tax=Agrocybe chaxingu TaxID=84603 RepID=A0A9W8JVQ7_9AGAR|nr:hypothetical protein NLJ89_g7768 [Agrocybe chaxingu]
MPRNPPTYPPQFAAAALLLLEQRIELGQHIEHPRNELEPKVLLTAHCPLPHLLHETQHDLPPARLSSSARPRSPISMPASSAQPP